MALWQRIERATCVDWPYYLEDDDICYFAREYISRGGFNAGQGNNLISNLKKPVTERGRYSWRYKEDAISQFARELNVLIPEGCYITSVPSSKMPDHPEYDPRLEQTLICLHRLKPSIHIVTPFANRQNRDPLHTGAERRTPEQIYDNLIWRGMPGGIDDLVIVDDVLTTGSNFKACQRLLREYSPTTRLIGIFWAKTVWPVTFDFDDI